MKNLSILALVGTALASNFTPEHDEMKFLWGTWKDTHAKNYHEAEEPYRLNIFVQNVNKINAHNAQNGTLTLGLNHFADLTPDEWQSKFANGHIEGPPSDETPSDQEEPEGRSLRGAQDRNLGSLPSSFDWRTKGAIGPVKNQVHCDGCWSFATTGALEALHQIKTGSLESFSEQQLLDCNKQSHGCTSGDFANGLAYAATYGIETEAEYPFIQKTGSSCKYSASKAQKVSSGHKMVTRNNANALMSAIVNQPVSVAIEATQSAFQFYKSGVITANCGSATNHAVLAVGYTTVNGVQAFIVKNQWGAHWGQNGYAYISTSGSANGGKGVCGILSYAGYPTA